MHMSELEYSVIRSKRKTLSLEVSAEAKLLIRAPMYASETQIKTFFSTYHHWAKTRLAEAQQKYAEIPRRTFSEGDQFPYLDQMLVLNYDDAAGRAVLQVSDQLILHTSAKRRPRHHIEQWYKKEARRIFSERLAFYSAQMHVQYSSLRIIGAKTRWGSCGKENSINLNWKLLMTPLPILDSVVVHELAHCRHKHHKSSFWQFVYDHFPEYEQAREWLNDHQHRLVL